MTSATSDTRPHDLELWKGLKVKAAYRLKKEGVAYVTTDEHRDLLYALINRDKHIVTGGFFFFGLSRVAMLKKFLDEQDIRIGKFPPPAPVNRPGTFADSV